MLRTTVVIGILGLTALPAAATPQQAAVREIRHDSRPFVARVWTERAPDGTSTPYYSLSLDGERFTEPKATNYDLLLRHGRFDPRKTRSVVDQRLLSRPESRLFLVQYWTQGIEDYREVIREMGGEVHRFLANHSNLVELDPDRLEEFRQLSFVRAIVPFHPAYKLEEELHEAVTENYAGELRVNILTMRRGGQTPVLEWIIDRGGIIEEVSTPTYLLSATLRYEQLEELAALDSVQWVDRWAPPESDINRARLAHGSDFLDQNFGYRGQGVRVEVFDSGTQTTHPSLTNALVHNGNTPGSHGTAVSGIVGSSGAGSINNRGQGSMPEAFLVISDYDFSYSGGSRYAHTGQLQNPALPYKCVIQTNSWGSGLTSQYNSTSQDMDLILFDHDRISICQSQSNAGTQQSRPQAWAKNIISVGGIIHFDSVPVTDDIWGNGASIGPANDGRIKPDLASYYDNIYTTDLMGSSGYSNGDFTSGFGGTSGATPIVAGHLGYFYQMWHLGVFGNETPGATVFENRPFNTTAKAAVINAASWWTFNGVAADLTRTHQGWGYPDVRRMSNLSNEMIIVDEEDVLTELQSTTYDVVVIAGTEELRVTMVYRDPPGTTSSSLHRINDLDLEVVSPSATTYHGNVGLKTGNYSQSGGTANTLDTVENVFIENPEAGTWTVTVTASEVNEDSHVETGTVDVDYALVVSGAREVSTTLPAAPTNLVGLPARGKVELRYQDNSDNEYGFEVERSSDGVSFSLVGTAPANRETFEDDTVTVGETYWYRVHSYNLLGPSADTNTVQVTVDNIEAAPGISGSTSRSL